MPKWLSRFKKGPFYKAPVDSSPSVSGGKDWREFLSDLIPTGEPKPVSAAELGVSPEMLRQAYATKGRRSTDADFEQLGSKL